MARKMIVPQYNAKDPDQITYMDGARDPISDLRRNASNASTRSLPILPNRNLPPAASTPGRPAIPLDSKPHPQVLRKPAPPPIPNKKPSLLSKTNTGSSVSSTTPQQQQRYRDDPVPLPRRSMAAPSAAAVRKPVPNLIDGDEAPPALPPRTGNGRAANLLDDEGDMKGLDGWEVLRPGG